jgi:CHAT domain-containing protein/tetratricopeptide (TPR) repeat protein
MRFGQSSVSFVMSIVLLGSVTPWLLLQTQAIAQTTPETNQASIAQLLIIGKQQYRQADFKGAIVTYEKVLASNPDAQAQIEAMLQLAEIDFWIEQIPQAETKTQRIVQLVKQRGDRRGEGQVLILLAAIERYRANYPKAAELTQQALKISLEVGDRVTESRAYLQLGLLDYLQQQLPQALEKFQQSLQTAQAANYQEGILSGHVWIAETHRKSQDLKQAEFWIQQQQALSQKTGNRLQEYDGLSILIWLRRDQKQAESILGLRQKQLAIVKTAGNPWFEKNTLVEIGYLDIAEQKFESGQRIYQQALAVAQQIDDRAIASVQAIISDSYVLQLQSLQKQQKYEQAREAGLRGLAVAQAMQALAKKSSSQEITLQALFKAGSTADNLARVAYNQNQDQLGAQYHRQSVEAFEQAITLAQKLKDRRSELQLNLGLVLRYVGQGQALARVTRYPEAIQMHDRAIALFPAGSTLAKAINDAQTEKLFIQVISNAYAGKGFALDQQQQYAESAQTFVQSLAFWRQQKERLSPEAFLKEEQSLLRSLRNAYQSAGQYAQAIEITQEALASAEKTNNFEDQISHLIRIASLQRQLGENQKALVTVQRALTIARDKLPNSKSEVNALNHFGQALDEVGRYRESREYYQQALPIAQKLEDYSSVQALLNNTSKSYNEQGEFLKALQPLQQIQKDSQEVLLKAQAGDEKVIANWCGQSFLRQGMDGRKTCISMIETSFSTHLNNLATTYQEMGEYNQALAYFQQAIELSVKNGNFDQQTIYLNNLGNLYVEMGDYPKGHKILRQALDLATQYKILLTQANALNNIASAYRSQGRVDQALVNQQKSLEINQSISNPSGIATGLNNIGLLYSDLGNYDQSLTFLQQSLNANQKYDLNPVTVLNNLATLDALKGNYPEAIKKVQQVLEIVRRTGNQATEPMTLRNMGVLYSNQANYAKAEEFYRQARDLVKRSGNRPAQLSDLLEQGRFYVNLGDYPKALDFSQQALKLSQDLGQKPQEVVALTNIGSTYRWQKQYAKAIPFYQQALTIVREIRDIGTEQQVLQRMAEIYKEQGEFAQALPLLQQVLTKQRELDLRPAQMKTLKLLGGVYTGQGQFTQAETALQEAQVLSESMNDPENRADIFDKFGDLLVKQNQQRVAIAFYKQSISIYESIRKGLTPLPKTQQQSYADSVAETYRKLADLLISQGRLAEAEQVLGLLKLQEIKDFGPPTRSQAQTEDVLLSKLEEEILSKHQNIIAFGQKLQNCKDKTDSNCSQLRTEEAQFKAEFNRFLDRIAIKTQQSCVQNQEQNCVSADEFADKFTTGTTKLIQAQPGTIVISPVVLDDKIWILVASEGGVLSRYESKVDRRTLGNKILELRQMLETPSSDITKLQATSKQLYDWLIQPIAPALNSSSKTTSSKPKNLIFSLDRVTRYIPMGVLFDGQQYLTQRYIISTVVSPADTQLQQNTLGKIEESSVLALGLSEATQHGSALPSVTFELDMIVRQSGIYPGVKLLNKAFTETALRDNLNRKKIIHLATHAKFVPSRGASFLALGTGEQLPIERIRTLDFSGVELVVLSACQTALGSPEQDGVEIPGLSSYFLRKGAGAVMASLWSVDDNSTALLMQKFYQHLSSGQMTKAQAMRQAQLDILNLKDDQGKAQAIAAMSRVPMPIPTAQSSRKPSTPGYVHPYYWAPFVLIGNGL